MRCSGNLVEFDTPAKRREIKGGSFTEMVESGVDITQIMSVSGHQNVQSVTPYVIHTLNSSKSALSKRQSLY